MAAERQVSETTQHDRETLQEKLKWLMSFRVAVATILLITAFVVQFRGKRTPLDDVTATFYMLAALFFFLSLIYIPLLKYIKNLIRVAYSQLVVDIIIITFAVYISGGTLSPLTFLYILVVVSQTMVSHRRGGYLAASLSSIFYGVMANTEYHHILPTMEEIITGLPQPADPDILYNAVTNIAAFYLVAFLSSRLALEVKRVEDELREKEIDYEALKSLNNDIVRNISSGLLTVDNDERITSFNLAAQEITAKSLEEVYDRDVFKTFPFFRDKISEETHSESSGALRWETWFNRDDGKDFYLGFSVSPLLDAGGKESGRIFIFQDLTALKVMEDELAKADRLAAVGRFAAGMAHEIRNPLASISGSIEILKKSFQTARDARDRKLMDIVVREIDRLNILIGEFLAYAKPVEPRLEDVDINLLLGETLEMIKNDTASRKRDISFLEEPGDIPLVPLDRGQIQQVMWNLIRNAVDAVENGGEVTVRTERHESDNGNRGLIIKVHDNGCGIPADIRDNIFSPFYTTKSEGSGLGLPIVHNIVKAHKGSIDIESLPGQGTTFRVFLPC